MKKIIGLDPGFANLGVAVVGISIHGPSLLSLDVVRTARSDRKMRVLETEDNARRVGELAAGLLRYVDADVVCLVSEAQNWPQPVHTPNAKEFLALLTEHWRDYRNDGPQIETLARHLADLCRPHAMDGPNGGWTTALKLALCWGVIGTVAATHRLPLLQVQPKDLKRHCTGSPTATKVDVQKALERKWGALPWPPQASLREHAADALAAAEAGLDSPIGLALQRGVL